MSNELKDRPSVRVLLRNFLVELMIYGILVTIYFITVLHLLEDVLTRLFHDSLVVYAVLALVLIISQGVLLESLTSFLLNWIKLDRLG
jgi:hypothetical protein